MGIDHSADRKGRMTRRALLGSGAVAGVAATLGAAAAAAPRAMPESWDEEVDVVVIGSGFAGLAAAHEALKAGASVALLEKMRVPGGNSIINGGVMAVAGSAQQAKEGIEDGPDVLLADMLKAGLSLNHVALARRVAEELVAVYEWTVDELGVEYKDVLTHMGGHAVPRAYNTANRSGSGIVVRQLAKLGEMGLEPRTRTFLKHIIRDADGRVKGVEVREGYTHPDPDSGQPKMIKARKAVVLATGGFGNDPAFRMMQDPRLTGDMDTTNHPGATSEALREAMNIGGMLIQPSWIQLGPWTSPDEKGMGMAPSLVQSITAAYGIWVDTNTGERFVDELADRKIRADAIIATGNNAIAIADAQGIERARGRGTNVDRMLETGVLKEYATLEDMAAAHAVPLEPLKATIGRYNRSIEAGKDADMGRYMQSDQFKLGKAPYYAVRLQPKIHHTMGGLAMNEEARALDLMTGEPIPGFYVAGEVAGGVHGASRLGSCATTECLVFGRIAGRNAAAEDAWG